MKAERAATDQAMVDAATNEIASLQTQLETADNYRQQAYSMGDFAMPRFGRRILSAKRRGSARCSAIMTNGMSVARTNCALSKRA